jgi:hypothetical protein
MKDGTGGFAWNKRIDMGGKILFIGTRIWAYRPQSARHGIRPELVPHDLSQKVAIFWDHALGQRKRVRGC